MTLDAATASAVKGSLREQRAAASHRRQLSRNTARKRANLQIIESRKQANIEAANARAAAAGRVQQSGVAAAAERRSDVRGERMQGRVASSAASTFTPSSNSNLFMTTLFVIVGLALFYQLVVRAQEVGTFVGSVGDLLHKVSSTTPLFQTVNKTS